MKKLLLTVLIALVLAFVLAACSGSEDSESAEDTSYDSASEAGTEDEDEVSLLESEDVDAEDSSTAVSGYIPEGEVLSGEPYTVIEGVTEIPREDRRYVCGYSTHVFIGDVIEQTSSDPLPADPFESEPAPTPLPATQYIVKLASGTSMIKGTWETGSEVTATNDETGYVVNQIGGDEGEGVELMEGDPLLVPGQRYLFATSYDSNNNWYWLVVQPEGDKRLSSDSERDRAIRDWQKGCKYEVTPEDVEASVEEGEDLTIDEQYTSGTDPDYVLREKE